jgi:hypothetical protein
MTEAKERFRLFVEGLFSQMGTEAEHTPQSSGEQTAGIRSPSALMPTADSQRRREPAGVGFNLVKQKGRSRLRRGSSSL